MHLLTLCTLIIAPPKSLSACLGTWSGAALPAYKTHNGCISSDPLMLQTVTWLMQTSVPFFFFFLSVVLFVYFLYVFNFLKPASEEIWQTA